MITTVFVSGIEKETDSAAFLLLSQFENISIVARYSLTAYKKLESIPDADVVFFEVAQLEDISKPALALAGSSPKVIITQQADTLALAFELRVFDCLVTPVSRERLQLTIDFLTELQQHKMQDSLASLLDLNKWYYVRDKDKCHLLKLANTYFIEAAGNYVKIVSNQHMPLFYTTLSAIEKKLPNNFFRANRGQLINLQHLSAVSINEKGIISVQLANHYNIEISQRQSPKFRERVALPG
ncbi:MAG TPA: LytTR family DNA-binding domain-containing protein [Chitinophagaceae bacterium]|nr:LytTR family DNA-binding domain-containing protein [Chitinophagaceae bacterium]